MQTYLFALIYGVFLLLAFAGWGAVIKLVFFRRANPDRWQGVVQGMALLTLIGGVMNLTETISRATVPWLLSFGAIFCVMDLIASRRTIASSLADGIETIRKDGFVLAGAAIIAFLTLIRYAGSATVPGEGHVDFFRYLVFPYKMLQTGAVGFDPFNERQLVSSLGGKFFLQAAALCALRPANAFILESGVSFLVLLGLTLSFLKRKGASGRTAIPALLLLSMFPHLTNASENPIGTVIFVSLFLALDWDETNRGGVLSRVFVVSILAACACAFKNTMIPACALFVIAFYTLPGSARRNAGAAALELASVGLLTILFLLPWMISLHRSSGTFLYPLLGRGYHGSVYGAYPMPWQEPSLRTWALVWYAAFGNPFVLSLAAMSYVFFRRKRGNVSVHGPLASLCAAALTGFLIITVATGGASSIRLSFPFTSAAVILLICSLLSDSGAVDKLFEKRISLSGYGAASLVLTALLAGSLWSGFMDNFKASLKSIVYGMKNYTFAASGEKARYENMQSSIPDGETVLISLEKPFLLDFARNRVFVADWPGGASLPPGIPLHEGADSLADYLLSNSIRYVAYSYGSKTVPVYSEHELSRIPITWTRWSMINSIALHRSLLELAETKEVLFDDGFNLVLDLNRERKIFRP
ncbi:MAG: hypothetical protein AB1742_03010 [bacterium]